MWDSRRVEGTSKRSIKNATKTIITYPERTDSRIEMKILQEPRTQEGEGVWSTLFWWHKYQNIEMDFCSLETPHRSSKKHLETERSQPQLAVCPFVPRNTMLCCMPFQSVKLFKQKKSTGSQTALCSRSPPISPRHVYQSNAVFHLIG